MSDEQGTYELVVCCDCEQPLVWLGPGAPAMTAGEEWYCPCCQEWCTFP